MDEETAESIGHLAERLEELEDRHEKLSSRVFALTEAYREAPGPGYTVPSSAPAGPPSGTSGEPFGLSALGRWFRNLSAVDAFLLGYIFAVLLLLFLEAMEEGPALIEE